MEGLIEGRIVHYVLESGPNAGEHRPAIVVRVWPNEFGDQPGVNLQVFTDGDGQPYNNDGMQPVTWKTSIRFSDGKEPGTCHWIERA